MQLGDNGGEPSHQHSTDSPTPAGIFLAHSLSVTRICGQPIAAFYPLAPPEIFLDSPLRPPRTTV